uniref:Mitochondrial inner membrane protein OXA1 n=1 Tax=Aegilops tauschii TaxID=37682 RepID=M8BC80_AEGTA
MAFAAAARRSLASPRISDCLSRRFHPALPQLLPSNSIGDPRKPSPLPLPPAPRPLRFSFSPCGTAQTLDLLPFGIHLLAGPPRRGFSSSSRDIDFADVLTGAANAWPPVAAPASFPGEVAVAAGGSAIAVAAGRLAARGCPGELPRRGGVGRGGLVDCRRGGAASHRRGPFLHWWISIALPTVLLRSVSCPLWMLARKRVYTHNHKETIQNIHVFALILGAISANMQYPRVNVCSECNIPDCLVHDLEKPGIAWPGVTVSAISLGRDPRRRLASGDAPPCNYTINGHEYTKGYYHADEPTQKSTITVVYASNLHRRCQEMQQTSKLVNNAKDDASREEAERAAWSSLKKLGLASYLPLIVTPYTLITLHIAVSNMVDNVPSLKGGGAFWFTDLTTPDALCIFPMITSLFIMLTSEVDNAPTVNCSHKIFCCFKFKP